MLLLLDIQCRCLHSRLPQRFVRPVSYGSPQRLDAQTRRQVSAQAKKKGGNKKKGPGSLMDPPKAAHPYLETDVIMQNLLMVESYKRKVGRPIMDDAEISEIAKLLWEAPFAVLAHDLQADPADPKYDYANKAALDLCEASWDELIGRHSSTSTANIEEREAREELLQQVKEHGTGPVHSVWRVGVKGRKFCISNGILWNIETPAGDVIGQAIAIHEWEHEDGTRGGPNAEANMVESRATASASQEEVQQAEKLVQDQADHVRHMKDIDGLTKGDPVLDEAVAELLQRKNALQKLQ